MNESRLIEIIRGILPAGSLLDLLATLAADERLITAGFFERLPAPIKEYLSAHVSAWQLFEFLIAHVPEFSMPVLAAINARLSGYAAAEQEGRDNGDRDHVLSLRTWDGVTSFYYGRLRTAIAELQAGRLMQIHFDTVFTRSVKVQDLTFQRLTLGQVPSISVVSGDDIGSGRPELKQHFLFRCNACGGIFSFNTPYPRMHPKLYGRQGEEQWICSRCYPFVEKDSETQEKEDVRG